MCFYLLLSFSWGCSPQKNQKKPVATPKSANWHWFFLVFFGFLKFPNWHWFFLVFLVFLVFFFGIDFGQNSKLETGFFFWFFFGVFGFFWFFLA